MLAAASNTGNFVPASFFLMACAAVSLVCVGVWRLRLKKTCHCCARREIFSAPRYHGGFAGAARPCRQRRFLHLTRSSCFRISRPMPAILS